MTNNLNKLAILCASMAFCSTIQATPARAASFFFSTGNPDGKIATGSRPETLGKVEIETGDDFILNSSTNIQQATFTGLLTNGAKISDITQVVNEIYRVFPKDSDTTRTIKVPTRTNSPSDIAFDSRDSSTGGLTYSTTVINPSFTALNSVLNGINQNAGGEGAVTGTEVLFTVTYNSAFSLPADSYFFIPQVAVNGGEFLWLSAARPIVAPGTPFVGDLQSWIRNDPSLAPDWLRIGTDIVGGTPAPTFNAAFSLSGETTAVPEPSAILGTLICGASVVALKRKYQVSNRVNK